MKSLRAVLATAGLLALTAPAALANSPGFTLSLSANSAPVVGKPMIITATGTIPVADVEFPYWFSLDAIPTSVTTTCPAGHFEGSQLANSTGGAVIVFTTPTHHDWNGSFSIPAGATPTAPGSDLLCGYVDDGSGGTLAVASMTLDVPAAGASPKSGTGSGPQSGPAQAAAGIRSCLALLEPSKAKGCIRDQIKLAQSSCKRLHSKKSRASCLRAVRKFAKKAASAG